MREGWQCPNCGSAHSPDVQTCPGVFYNPSITVPNITMKPNNMMFVNVI